MLVTDPCVTEGLFVDNVSRAPGMGNLRSSAWANPGTIQTKTALKKDPSTGFPYVEPIDGAIAAEIAVTGRSLAPGYPDPGPYTSGVGISMLKDGAPFVSVSITNTGQRYMRIMLGAHWHFFMQVATTLTTALQNIRTLGLSWTHAIDAVPSDPLAGVHPNWGGTEVITSHYDAGGFGGYVGVGGARSHQSWWNGGGPTLAPGSTWTTKGTIGHSAYGFQSSPYDSTYLDDFGIWVVGLPVAPA